MSSLSDILTAAKNVVTSVNQLGQTYLAVEGAQQMADITAATQVMTGQGRLARVVIVDAGSAAGAIYDSSSTSTTTGKLWTLPTTAGITVLNLPINNGIVVAPGTGQRIVVSYSQS